MKEKEVARRKEAVVRAMGPTGEIVRRSLLKRMIRHKKGCQTCARGDGHPAWVLTVNYPGGRNKQIGIRSVPACHRGTRFQLAMSARLGIQRVLFSGGFGLGERRGECDGYQNRKFHVACLLVLFACIVHLQ